jgi:hypothetical protein
MGYRRVRVLNENGADIYADTEENVIIGHEDFESELWIKSIETEGWAEIYSEEENQMFVKLNEIDKQQPSDDVMLASGYKKIQVALTTGADLYASMNDEDVIGHVDFGTELWLTNTEDVEWAVLYKLHDDDSDKYIKWNDIIIILQNENSNEDIQRSIKVTSTLESMSSVSFGTEIENSVELIGFLEEDQCEYKWFYSNDNGASWILAEDEKEQSMTYVIDGNNWYYIWKAQVAIIHTDGELAE